MDSKTIIFEKDIPFSMLSEGNLGAFKPSIKELTLVERELEHYLIKNQIKLSKKFKGYYRQYVGIETKNKTKLIRGNFFCHESDNWKSTWVVARDGGDCYFQFSFDLKSKKFTEFHLNGES